MSWLDKFQNSRFGRPFRKRQKLGEDEDDWCDALSNLHMDSSSSDEFVDAHEQVPVNSSPKGRKRKKTKSKNKNKKQKSSEIFGDSSSSSSTADTFTGMEGKAEIHPANPLEEQPARWSTVKGKKAQRKEKLQKRKSSKMQCPPPSTTHQGWKERSKSTGHDGYPFNPHNKQCSDSGFQFKSSPEIASSSSNVDEQMDTQHAQGGLTNAKLLEVAKAIGSNIGTVNRLGICLGFTYSQLNAYHPQGISVGYSRTTSMLQDWKHKTSQQQQLPELLAALKKSDLCSLADKLDINKGEISERQIEQLARDLYHDVDYKKVRLLGKQLGYTPTEVFDFCGYEKKKGISGVLSMLRDWRDKTFPKSRQIPRLHEALQSADLKHLIANLQVQEVGISDDQLQQLAEDLFGDDYRNTHSLGQKLGFRKSKVESYYGKGKPRKISGILSMLRAWRDVTNEENQKRDLLAALKDTNLQKFAGHLHQSEELDQGAKRAPIPQRRKVTVTLMTSSQMYTIDGLKKELETLKKLQPDLIENVKVLQLPYSRIQYYKFTEDVDIMILCHSIENRRFAITNVTDSLYDEFLDYCHWKFGQDKIVVVAHDFPPEAKEVRDVKMDSFKHTQWTTFEKAGLVMICGKMDKKPEMEKEDWASLVGFLEAASKSTPIGGDTNPPLAGKKGGKADSNKSKTSNAGTSKIANINVVKSFSSRKPIIYLCTSWGFHTISGFRESLQALSTRSYSGYEVRAQELPYSCLDDFRFKSEVNKTDAMILCHSVQNRGFSITDVPNSIYDEYLRHCNQVFGKEHLAVIVHDFECTEEILRINMDTFRRTQPKTFQLAGFVALARKLDVADVQLPHDDLIQLQKFVEKL